MYMYVMEIEKKIYLLIYEIFLMENIIIENNVMYIKNILKFLILYNF